MLKQALSSLLWKIYNEASVSLFFLLSLYLVNVPQVLYLNPGYLKFNLNINLFSPNKNYYCLLFHSFYVSL